MIEIDDLRPERATSQSYICHVNSAGIFPVQWSLKNGVHLSAPPGMFVQACHTHSALEKIAGPWSAVFRTALLQKNLL